MILAPVVRGRKGEYKKEIEKLARQGFVRARIDGVLRSLDEEIVLDRRKNHSIEVVVDRLLVKPGIEARLEASIATAAKLADGLVIVAVVNGDERLFPKTCMHRVWRQRAPDRTSFIFVQQPLWSMRNLPWVRTALEIRRWQDNYRSIEAPAGGRTGTGCRVGHYAQRLIEAAKQLKIKLTTPFEKYPAKTKKLLLEGGSGFAGILEILQSSYDNGSEDYREWLTDYMSPIECEACHGKRLRPGSLAVRVKGLAISELTDMPISRALLTVGGWELNERETQIAGRVLDEIRRRLEFFMAVGLHYLSMARSSATLSGGESQRIRLATQIGSKLRGVLYVLDEPSIGLHPRDNERLLETLAHLRDMGNTVLVVEHDAETIERADYVIDLGPGAGRLGGELVACGTPEEIRQNPKSLTGRYLSGAMEIPVPESRRRANGNSLTVTGATEHNLKNVDVEIPAGACLQSSLEFRAAENRRWSTISSTGRWPKKSTVRTMSRASTFPSRGWIKSTK